MTARASVDLGGGREMWTVTWVGSNGTGDGLPHGVINEPQAVTVQEIQSIVR